jgi:hypothetical protein
MSATTDDQAASTGDAFDLENLIMDAKSRVAVMRHLMRGMEDGEAIAWSLPIDRLTDIVEKPREAFDAELAAQTANRKDHQAELA